MLERAAGAAAWSRPARGHAPLVTCGLAGLAAAAAVGLAEPPLAARSPSPGQQLLASSFPDLSQATSSILGICGIAGMVLSWLWLVRLARRDPLGCVPVAVVCGVWCLPLLIAGPVLSADAYAYGAIGALMGHGLDPYAVGPAALHGSRLLSAMDPRWAHSPAPYGPLGLLAFELAVAVVKGSLGGTLLMLKLLTAAATLAAVAFGVARMPSRSRAFGMALLAGSPIITVGLVGSIHVDALAAMFAAAASFAWHRDRVLLSVALASLGAAVKAPFGLLVLALIVAAARSDRSWSGGRRLVRLAGVAVGCYAVPALVVGDPFGFVHSLRTPYEHLGMQSPVESMTWLVRHAGTSPHVESSVAGGIVALAQLAGLVLAIVALSRSAMRDPALCAGLALAALTLTSPLLHGWYLSWPLVLLTPFADRHLGVAWPAAGGVFALLMEAARPKYGFPFAGAAITALACAATIVAWAIVRTNVSARPNGRYVPARRADTSLPTARWTGVRLLTRASTSGQEDADIAGA